MSEATFRDCYARLGGDGSLLTVGNDRVERRWRVGPEGGLRALSLLDRVTGREWLVAADGEAGEAAAGPPATLARETDALAPLLGEEALTVAVAAGARRFRLSVYPGLAAVLLARADGVEISTRADGSDGAGGAAGPTGVEQNEPAPPAGGAGDAATLDRLHLAPQHLRLTHVALMDRTDAYNELVSEREWLLHPAESSLRLSGCLLYAEETVTGDGLAFVKLAPLPHARPKSLSVDFEVRAKERSFAVIEPEDYRVITVAYSGGKWGRIAALQRLSRCLRRVEPGRDGLFLSNTWGDRNRDGRINEPFLRGEIEACARLGVEVVQIDDGWQAGTTSNSVDAKEKGGVWEGFRDFTSDFWSVNPERLPNGLSPLVGAAREKGMRFGLWFGPDSSDDFARWEEDAETLLRLHREHGVDYFKIDGVKVRAKRGERNLRRFFDRVLAGSGGRVVFDFDITAETRSGYFGMPDVGPLFVENRYTDWHRYWPHQTLRCLWQLAHHLDPARLRLEWLNHARNVEQYAEDPLAPAAFRPDYLFATVMLASPLGWFEAQSLPEGYFADAAPLVATWKAHRDALRAATVYPLGTAPDGVSWTGFAAVAPDGKSAYVLAFRGWNDPGEDQWLIEVPTFAWADWTTKAEALGGRGTLSIFEEGAVVAEIPGRNDFLFARLWRE